LFRFCLALALEAERECELVMLCHSLAVEQCIALATAIRVQWPKTRIVLVEPQRTWDGDFAAVVDATVPAEPERLIGRTMELLGQARHFAAGEVPVRGGVARAGPFA
jgi:hypothetical protein